MPDVQRTFLHLTRIVPRNGWVVLNGDDANLKALGPLAWTRVVRVGLEEQNDVRITNFAESAMEASFRLTWQGKPWAEVKWNLSGIFNARNAAMAALAAGLALFPDDPTKLKLDALAKFRGVKRRQELLVNTPKLKVVEDFGHHPTALAETLQSLRARFPGHLIHAAFEPRSNTSRTKVLQAAFLRALGFADEVYLGAIARPEKLKPEERFDVEAVIQQLATQGVDGYTAPTHAALLDILQGKIAEETERPQVVVFFTNGDFGGIIGKFV
ncbi:MAG: Mur ligase family protein, partial [Opitutus sp.]